MLKEIVSIVEPAQLFAVITFIVALVFYKSKKEVGPFLWIILLINAITEVSSTILLYEKKSIGLLYSINVILHHGSWLLLLSKSIKQFAFFKPLFICFIVFSFINLFFMEGTQRFNFNTFILGSLLYIVLFIYESFCQLKQENFAFFQSNHYVLLFAPVLFFFGLSFVFGFKSSVLALTIIFGNVNLYEFIVMFVNIIYYTLIITYIYREKKLQHDV